MTPAQSKLYYRLSVLSKKTAAGKASENEMVELDAVQVKLGIKGLAGAINTRKARQLNRAESTLSDLEEILRELLTNKGKKK